MSDKKRLKRIWRGMKTRCYNSKCRSFENYGDRGVKVCNEWLESFETFYNWAMANGYSDDLTIDRIDVNGNYEPCNCRWATMKEQSNNKRNNVCITYGGATHTLAEWSDITGVSRSILASRYNSGCASEEIIFGKNGKDILKNLREAFGLTQYEMARRVHTTRENIANYETGRREPNAAFYQKLQNAFGVSDDFIGGIILEFAVKKKLNNKQD